MVKFGKEYRKFQIKQWKAYYIDYKSLKQEIRSIIINIERQKDNARGTDASEINLGHPSLKPMELDPDKSIIIQEGQDLQSLYNLKYGQELKNFIDLLEKEFRKSYIHFVNQEKELYKKVNGHCYSNDIYNELNLLNVLREIKEILLTLKLTNNLNVFINDNVTAMKKILKKFDKKFHEYFGVIGPKFILSHLTSKNSDLEYFLQFKLIDESTTICENNFNILYKRAKNLLKNPQNNIQLNEDNINIYELENHLKNYTKKIYEYLNNIDEITYFKIQYREWFYYAKHNNRIVKNNPLIYEYDIYNPVLSSTFYKDSILEKCISNPNAVKEIKKSQSPLSFSNLFNLYLLYIHSCFYGSMLTNIFPLIPNYFDTYIVKKENNKALFLLPLITTYFGYLIPYSIFMGVNYRDKKNTFMTFSYILSYLLIFISGIILIFVDNSTENKYLKVILITISRFLLGFADNKMMSKKYITLHIPKFYLSNISKKFIISELIGEIVGPLISLLLILIPEFKWWEISYTKFNCIGWYSMLISLIMGIIHLICFTNPSKNEFMMVIDEENITGSKYYQKSEKELQRKQYQKEQDLIYKKQYNSMKNKINKNEEKDNLIIRTSKNKEDKEDKDEPIKIDEYNDKGLEEKLINTSSNSNQKLSESENNSLEASLGDNPALTEKQKNMINIIDKELEKRNEMSNFDDMDQIQKKIKSLINKEKKEFGYINQNILLILIIYLFSSLCQIHLIFNYIYYIKENIYSEESDLYMFCVLIFILFLPQILKIIFIFPFYQVNYRFKIFIIIFVANLLIVNIPLMFEEVYNSDYAFIILNILLVFGCNVINLSCSCYLSFIMLPDWEFLCLGVGHWINYTIIIGQILGGIISFIFCVDNHINHWIWMGITFAFFIYIIVLIYFTRIIRIKGIVRIIRKNAIEANE